MSLEQITAKGFKHEVVSDILKKINVNEYKRRQAAPALKITSKAFGLGRRIPLAEKYTP